ncbi:glycogen/starch synthase [Sulfolobus acidocaldarius]|uniref:Glycosyl transferase n=4 Tax=Sulfolobus acidocaldarius TaxID=2285 RepID=F2Z6E6_SULAC|nr:glycogen/starch synthase [Sulfolobus acidocaldarius]AAY80548.1 glycosyl transferase [Sulfolobus acidocaldarius DSM 639]AGE71137.1 glycosyl transferase [Sulfolobus acidocaldarius N8]AGE73407.1 glycosyl transferase [Sulfolobus acidocaldarius Ron12/I]ALU28591.1 glycogen synthase [Sulfolobus acidocaldarius]ALU31304.1 glycogen synthase [Sulfolobus acidocaldarius]
MKRYESLWFEDELKHVWMISAELEKVASLGGLGPVVYNLGKELVKQGIKVTVIMPSHGRHLNDYYRSLLKLNEISLVAEGDRIGIDGKSYHYKLGFEHGNLDGMNVVLIKGLDYNTGRIIDSWNIYDNAMEKSSLLARAVEKYAKFSIPNDIPSIIHVHDWHSVIAGVTAKFTFEARRVIVPLVFTVHLLNKVSAPWHYASEDWSGLMNYPHYIWRIIKHDLYTTREVWDFFSSGSIEKFGSYEADLITSVSKSYLTYDIFNFIGNWIENKSCIHYNGTDWEVEETKKYAYSKFGTEDRAEIRKRLFDELEVLRVTPEDYTTGNILWNNRFNIGIKDDWTYSRLENGPLILFAGRMVYQKGIDSLLIAFDEVLKTINNARLIILGLPSSDYGLLQNVVSNISRHGGNIRIILGKMSKELYRLFYYSASVFVIPSRWEPFGLVAVESMAVGTPVVAYSVGGLRESIVDIRVDQEQGTGLLVEPENVWELSKALISALSLSMASETNNGDFLKYTEVKTNDVKLWDKIRQNCVRRVNENFRWSASAKQLQECYSKAQTMAKYRLLASF